jgi:hypothetical protein
MPSEFPVLAAISGAIATFLADEEVYLASAGLAVTPAAPPTFQLWALAGRQQAMQFRLLLQRRSLR